jgi:phosphoribosylglycinamide formyltransferase 2
MQIGQRLGTPLSPSATRVMLLGAGELGKEVIIALQRLGVEVIAVDRYPDAPGHQVAHRAHVIDMTDAARCARWSRPSAASDRPRDRGDRDRRARGHRGGRPGRGDPHRARDAAHDEPRGHPPARRRGARLATSPYAFADSFDAFSAAVAKIGMPCVVKPVMSSSGKGSRWYAARPT